MKAAMWVGVDKVEIREIPIPEIKEEEALIKVRAAGVCATDYHIMSGKVNIGVCPTVQGHEICGEVVKINTKRTDIKIGQRCVIATSIGCGHCDCCREGKEYICNESQEIGYFPHYGGYAEYTKVPVSAIVPISDKVSDRTGAILESAVCPTESLMRIGLPLASDVVIMGTGPAGISFIKAAKVMGASKIIVIVRDDIATERAYKYGATHVIDLKKSEDPEGEVERLTDGKRADMVIDATGAKPLIERAANFVKKGGDILLYGIPSESEQVVLPIKKLVVEEISVHGTVGNTKAWYPLVKLIESGILELESLVTHEFCLEDIDKAFDLYRRHDKSLIKAIIKF